MDLRARHSHRGLNGKTIKFGEMFSPVAGVFMAYPGDLEHSLNPKALAAECINCRSFPIYKIDYIAMANAQRDDAEKSGPLPAKASAKPRAKRKPKADPVNAPELALKPRSKAERVFLAELDVQGEYAGAFMATTPPRFQSGKSGYYQPQDHSITQRTNFNDAARERAGAGRKWIGTFAHEYGHAIDFDGMPFDAPRSKQMRVAMLAYSADIIANKVKGKVSPTMKAAVTEIADAEAADYFALLWDSGNFTIALQALQRDAYKSWLHTGGGEKADFFLDYYSLGNVLDFLGAVTDLQRGQGHSKDYYRRFPQYYDTEGFMTVGHSTEAFANAFMAHTLPRRAILSEMIEQMAPRTVAEFRKIIAERAKDAGKS